jgi:hypothetical protein
MLCRGLYIGKYSHTHPPPGGGISAVIIWGKNIQRGREKRGKIKTKEEKGKKRQKREVKGKINAK